MDTAICKQGSAMSRLYILVVALLLAACGEATVTDTPPALTTEQPGAAETPTPVADAVAPELAPTGATEPAETLPPVAIAATATTPPSPTATTPPTATPPPTAPAPLEVFVNLVPVADGLAAPVALADPADGSGRLFVADQVGQVWVVAAEGQRLPTPLLDVSGTMVSLEPGYDERGLLGLALHPEFADAGAPGWGTLYVYYSAPLTAESPPEFNHTGRVSSFRLAAEDPNRVDPATERVILEIPQPQFNHNGGQLTFGPDGALYIGLGDGGAQYDFGVGHGPEGNAQDLSSLLGKILRLSVTPGAEGYTVPADNPLLDAGGRPEIFAYGFRNPYRFAFDEAGQGALYAADVGQDPFEELNIVTAGGNYGWRVREGYSCFNLSAPLQPLDACAAEDGRGAPLADPILAYDHSVGRSIIAGYVYRGEGIASLRGRYVFGDWQYDAQGLVLLTAVPTESGWVRSPLSLGAGTSGLSPLSYLLGFGQDAAGELYALTTESLGPTGSSGRVFQLVPARR
jgi:glucose/arabinose dehydrogenase